MSTIGIISKLNLMIDEIFISEWTLSLSRNRSSRTGQVGIYKVGTGQVWTDKVLHLRNVKSRYLV